MKQNSHQSETKSDSTLYRKILGSEKLILLGKMASSVAHEINNPIMIIQNYISLIMDDIKEKKSLTLTEKSEYFKIFEEIILECTRMAKITKNLLDFSRTTPGRPKSKKIEPILLSVLKLVEPMIVKNQIQINLNINAEKVDCVVKRDEIQQVFINILDNSIFALKKKYPKFVSDPNKNVININLKNEEIERNSNSIEYLVINFHDDGIGIPKNIYDRIFEPFFSTKRTKETLYNGTDNQGLGLGLSYCQSIIENYGGFIRFDSEFQKFSHFHVYLPISNKDRTNLKTDNDLIKF